MELNTSTERALDYTGDALLLSTFEDEESTLFTTLNNTLQHCFNDWKAEEGSITTTSTLGQLPTKNILVIGLGKKEEFTTEHYRNAVAKAVISAREKKWKNIAVNFLDTPLAPSPTEQAKMLTLTIDLALYDYTRYKNKEKINTLDTVTILGTNNAEALHHGRILARAINKTKELVNTPPSDKSTETLEEEARQLEKNGVEVTVFNEKELKEKGMNGILEVGRGSPQESKLIIMSYLQGTGKATVFVGKGVMFDTGGVYVKPYPHMGHMKCDMGGAATVLGIMKGISELQLAVNVIGLMPAAENAVDGNSYKPGDIITMYNKKTVEVGHTDAEGRLLLADALSYATELDPSEIIDYATLTGAIVAALGEEAAGAFTTSHQEVVDKLLLASKRSGDKLWQLPIYDAYQDMMKGTISDLNNISNVKGQAGSASAAAFLSNFVNKKTWAHIDIAGTAYISKAKGYKQKGATGHGVLLGIEFVKSKLH